MAFWSGQRIARNQHIISDFDAAQIDCAAYNLRVGNCYFCTSEDEKNYKPQKILAKGETFVIPPGQFAFLITKETVCIPDNTLAFISMRTMKKFQGLINVSGFHVDPGYEGNLVYSVFNAGPTNVDVSEGEKLFKIWFCDLDQISEPQFRYRGKSASISNDLVKGMSGKVLSLRDLSAKLEELEKLRPSIDTLNLVYRTLVIGVIGALLLAIFSGAYEAWR
jgi:dCTP deaminase